ncbi:hypothetical protein B0H13DRAFT_2378631 [Mycena leptocephala]|nr:hypothetical protein B0H13DRAFT_2378631 [Mycena leptocephala]
MRAGMRTPHPSPPPLLHQAIPTPSTSQARAAISALSLSPPAHAARGEFFCICIAAFQFGSGTARYASTGAAPELIPGGQVPRTAPPTRSAFAPADVRVPPPPSNANSSSSSSPAYACPASANPRVSAFSTSASTSIDTSILYLDRQSGKATGTSAPPGDE